MGTRSDIIVQRADGKWARIYCHWDGYVDHNGKLLFEHYNDQEKADALVALGDISSLGEEIGEKHAFDWREKLHDRARKDGLSIGDAVQKEIEFLHGHPEFQRLNRMCLVYGRDRGEKGTAARVFDSLAAAWPENSSTEFTYVFAEGEWYVGDPDAGSQMLRDLGAVLRGEDEAPKTAIKAFGGNFVIGHR